MMGSRWLWIGLVSLSFLQACESGYQRELNKEYGPEKSVDRVTENQAEAELYHQTQDIFNKRCVVCHACYDAPCQLKLTAAEGIDRGASSEPVYNSRRLRAADPMRLFEDAHSTEQWRNLGFYAVLNEREQSSDNNLKLSVLYQSLLQKKQHPLPSKAVLDSDDFDFSLNPKQSCPNISEFPKFQKEKPLWGMPYGLPAISDEEMATVTKWVTAGAKMPRRKPLSKSLKEKVDEWEKFFNGNSLKAQLVNRYLYEHLYLAHLYFPEDERFFNLVRSRTPPGQPIDIIATRRVYDDPKVGRVYYRLRAVQETIVDKTHQPYKLDEKRKAFWQRIFYQTEYQVSQLPSYAIEQASNPFITFKQLPSNSRYRFLLDEAQYSIMNFIKGPVCRGQTAVDVINDHFWVAFVNPDIELAYQDDWYVDQYSDLLTLPANWDGEGNLFAWNIMAEKQKQFLQKKAEYLRKTVRQGVPITERLIWDGENGENKNAALTVFRHFNSATVSKGFLGRNPKTSWVISYSLLERIHYLLVAGFDVYGSLTHQLYTRLYMDFLRMEGEANFIAFLPESQRKRTFEAWYIDAELESLDYFDAMLKGLKAESLVAYSIDEPYVNQLQNIIAKRTHAHGSELPENYPKPLHQAWQQFEKMQGKHVSYLPQLSVIKVNDGDKQYWLSLVHHTAHKNITNMFLERKALVPKLDTASLLNGIVGAYPNAFFEVDISQINKFVSMIEQIRSAKGYRKFADVFAIRRTNPNFWKFSDQLHQAHKNQAGVRYGVLDYNRFENL